MVLVEIQNISYEQEGKQIVHPLNLELFPGDLVGLLGESGTGKTTLLQLLAGFLEPATGQIRIEQERVLPPSLRLVPGHPKIKLVRQDYGLFPNISLRENIAYELRQYVADYRNERVEYLLRLAGLEAIAHKLPRQTSGGEQQRCVIARAIADEPRLLLLDEPFSQLDRRNKQLLKNEIRAIIDAEQMACLFVTHEVADAYGAANRLLIMQQGKLVQIGTPESVYRNPANAYVAELTGPVSHWPTASGIQFIRPEEVTLGEGTVEGQVIRSEFLGFAYLITLQVDDNQVVAYSRVPMAVGQRIQLTINQ